MVGHMTCGNAHRSDTRRNYYRNRDKVKYVTPTISYIYCECVNKIPLITLFMGDGVPESGE